MSSRRPSAPRAAGARSQQGRSSAARPSRSGAKPEARQGTGRTGSRTARAAGTPGSRPAGPQKGARAAASATRPGASRPGAAPRAARTAGTAAEPTTRRFLSFGAPGPDGEPGPTVSLRALALFLVALMAFAVLAPTLRYAVAQQEELRELNAQVSEAEERNADLERQLARWQDPEYVQAQARDRLGYVMPGETPYVVVDPETVTGGESAAEAEAAERAVERAAATPWYLRAWESVQVAGESVVGEEDPSGLTVPAEEQTP